MHGCACGKPQRATWLHQGQKRHTGFPVISQWAVLGVQHVCSIFYDIVAGYECPSTVDENYTAKQRTLSNSAMAIVCSS